MRMVIIFLVWAAAAYAEPIGIAFDDISPGTSFHYRDSSDGPFVEIYLGRQGAHHVIERRKGNPYGDTEMLRRFDQRGLELERTYASGRVVRYSPYNCDRAGKACRHFVDAGRGERRVTTTVEDDGLGLTLSITFEGVPQPKRKYVIYGAYGMIDFLRENDRQRKLEEIRQR